MRRPAVSGGVCIDNGGNFAHSAVGLRLHGCHCGRGDPNSLLCNAAKIRRKTVVLIGNFATIVFADFKADSSDRRSVRRADGAGEDEGAAIKQLGLLLDLANCAVSWIGRVYQ